MLSGLSAYTGIETFHQLLGQYVMLSDSQCNGQFLVHHFLGHALKDGVKTYLISFAQAFVHYNTICSKLGVSLTKAQDSGQLVFVDCLTHLLDLTHTEVVAASKDPGLEPKKTVYFSLDRGKRNCLVNLYRFLAHTISPLVEGGQPVALIIDDLSVCLSLGVSVQEVVDFLHYCQVLLKCSEQGSKGCLVTMTHADEDTQDEKEHLLKGHLCHDCHLHIHISGLSTGYSKDVHGEISIDWREKAKFGNRLEEVKETRVHRTAQFKLTDRNVTIFAKGLSSAVL